MINQPPLSWKDNVLFGGTVGRHPPVTLGLESAKDEMRNHFQSCENLEVKVKMLQGRMLKNEPIHEYYNNIMRMYGIPQSLNKNYTEEEKATKPADWLIEQLFKVVQLINLI